MTISEQFITVQGYKTFVRTQGDPAGQPIIFVHGNPDSSVLWLETMSHLPALLYAIAPDCVGFGQTEPDMNFDYSIANRGQWVADVLAALGVERPVIVVGHDHGGPFAASYAIQFEDQVRGLVLMNTLFNRDYSWHPFGKIWRMPIVGEISIMSTRLGAITTWVLWRYARWGHPGLSYAYIRDLLAETANHTMWQILPLYRHSTPKDLAGWDDRLQAFVERVPTRVFWGDQDKFIPLTFPKRLHTWGAEVTHFPNSGHWVMLDHAAEIGTGIGQFALALD